MGKCWVLGGGGARGAYQCGVMLNLMKTEVPEAIYGTSAGALNACALSFRDAEWHEKMWKSIKSRGDVFARSWNPFSEGFFTSSPLEKMIRSAVDGSSPAVPVVVTYVDLLSGETIYASTKTCPKEIWAKRVLASASIPGIVPPVDGRFCDGGLTDNIPLAKAIQDGFEDITVVLCSNRKLPVCHSLGYPAKLQIVLRAVDIMFNNSAKDDLRSTFDRNELADYRRIKVRVIEPPVSFKYQTLDFSPRAIFDGIELGKNWRAHNAV